MPGSIELRPHTREVILHDISAKPPQNILPGLSHYGYVLAVSIFTYEL